MVPVWLKALLFVGGGTAAAAGAAYVTGVLDPWLGRQPQVVAALPELPAQVPAKEEAPAASETVPLPQDPETADKQARLTAPIFDLVRVEPDGSVVVAGKAAPNSKIELLHDERVLAETRSGGDGDFVIVLDERLPAGDYALSLRATAEDGTVVGSTQTAVVSIPETDDGQVLVMVDEPGAPATLLTVPEAPASAESEPAAAAEEEQVAAAPDADQENGEPAAETVAAAEPEAEETEIAAAEPAKDPVETPAAAQDSAPVEESETPAAEGEQEVAVAAADANEPAATETKPAVTGNVVVEAVEIEGDVIFVAGYADAGRTVRVYANEILLGDAKVSEGGRFLIEARRALPVGSYMIRADLLLDDGSVIARAAVPFEREPGESIAAVAVPQAPETEAPAEAEADIASAEPEAVAQAEPEEETVTAAEEPSARTEDETAAAEPAAAEDAPAQEQQVVAAPTEQEPKSDANPADEAAAAPAEEKPVEPAAQEPEIAVAEEPVTAADEPTQEQIVAAPAETPAQPAATAPALQRVDGAVIIRRGDTLWRISRRVYGQGVRYSTIYLANQDQIRNPDRIWPGQVFSVPLATAEGEAADMEAVAEQVVAPDGQGGVAQ